MTLSEYCKLNEPSSVTTELIEKLREYSTEDEYIIGVLALSENDRNRRTIIDYINSAEDVSYSNIILYALELDQNDPQEI